jgi:hypothetical protein
MESGEGVGLPSATDAGSGGDRAQGAGQADAGRDGGRTGVESDGGRGQGAAA